MKKPEIVNQIVIDDEYKEDAPIYSPRAVTIQVFTEKARAWIEHEAPQFGSLSEPIGFRLLEMLTEIAKKEKPESAAKLDANLSSAKNAHGALQMWSFRIFEAYDPKDVIAYLISGFAERQVGGEWVVRGDTDAHS